MTSAKRTDSESTSSPVIADSPRGQEQRRRFIEAAREAGASEDEVEFDRALGAIVKAKA